MVLDWMELNGSHGVCVCSAMPDFGDDHDKMFSISAAEWHDRSHHTARDKLRRRLEREALASGFDVCAVQTSLPTAKTCRVDRYCDRIREAVKHFDKLYEHYQKMRPARWKTYKCEQQALHKLCLRIKGSRRAKRSDIVVAFGAASFVAAKKGGRAFPVKKFRKYLARYVTLVLVDEFRTSRVCSHLCALEGAPLPAAAEADERAAEEEEGASSSA